MSDTGSVLRVAVPSLEPGGSGPAEPGVPVLRLPAAEWLVARGNRKPDPASSWREWLVDGAGLGPEVLDRFPAGPCLHAAWTGEPARGCWAGAAPVHLLTAIDHLQLAAPAPLPLDPGEADDLVESLAAHLAGTGFRLHAFPGRGWLLECPMDLECTAPEPAVAIGRNLRELLPAGRDAARVRSLVNELQMLLHEHPVNERRATRSAPAVNSLWPWGFGAAQGPRATARGVLVTDDDWLLGLWRLHGGEIAPPDRLGEILRRRGGVLRVALAPAHGVVDPRQAWAAAEASVLAPARAALRDGTVQRISLLAGHAWFEASRSARWRAWRRSRPLDEVLR